MGLETVPLAITKIPVALVADCVVAGLGRGASIVDTSPLSASGVAWAIVGGVARCTVTTSATLTDGDTPVRSPARPVEGAIRPYRQDG